jgi:hypothetical protein
MAVNDAFWDLDEVAFAFLKNANKIVPSAILLHADISLQEKGIDVSTTRLGNQRTPYLDKNAINRHGIDETSHWKDRSCRANLLVLIGFPELGLLRRLSQHAGRHGQLPWHASMASIGHTIGLQLIGEVAGRSLYPCFSQVDVEVQVWLHSSPNSFEGTIHICPSFRILQLPVFGRTQHSTG